VLTQLDEIVIRGWIQLEALAELRRTVMEIKHRIVTGGPPLLPRSRTQRPHAPQRRGRAS